MPRVRGSDLRTQEREVVLEVLKFMKKEAEEGLQLSLKATSKRTAKATGVSERTIRRIVSSAKDLNSAQSAFRTPGKKRSGKRRVTGIDCFTQGRIRRCIHNFHVTEKELPNVGLLLNKLKTDFNYQGSATSLTRILNDLGFKWKRTEDKKKLLIENIDIRFKRIEYLRKITKYREDGHPIIYTGESFVYTSQSDGTAEGQKKGQRVIIVHAGSEAGFVPNALFMFAGTNTGDQDNMSYGDFEMWLRNLLIPNLPPNSVVVVDNASYHNKLEEKTPNSYSKKSAMETWLLNRDIPFHTDMCKPELYKLILMNKEKIKRYKMDSILRQYNHTVVRLPPHHADLNPMEMAWVALKDHVAKKSKNSDLYIVMKLIEEKANAMGDEWYSFCTKVKDLEEEYTRSDEVIDVLTDQFDVNVSDNESMQSEKDSEDGSDSSDQEVFASTSKEIDFVKVEPQF